LGQKRPEDFRFLTLKDTARYRRHVERLADFLDSNPGGECDELIAAIQSLVVAVVVHVGTPSLNG
jgi:hypothetical protein